MFRPLEKDHLREVVRLEFQNLVKRLVDQGITMELSDDAADKLLEKGYNPRFGARPVRRTIEQEIEFPLRSPPARRIRTRRHPRSRP